MAKYIEIYRDILSKIKSGKYEINTCLPTEKELSDFYDCSRDTVRKALNILLQNGYIQKIKGKGSLVLDLNTIEFPVSGISSYKELQKIIPGESKTYVNIFLQTEVFDPIKKELAMDKGKMYHIERVREIDGEKVILDIDYLNGELIKDLSLENAENSLYEYIEEDLGLVVSFAKKEITVVKASEREMDILDMGDYDLLVCVKSYTYLDDGKLFEYTISKHRPDKFRFVDFARRNKEKTIWFNSFGLFLLAILKAIIINYLLYYINTSWQINMYIVI